MPATSRRVRKTMQYMQQNKTTVRAAVEAASEADVQTVQNQQQTQEQNQDTRLTNIENTLMTVQGQITDLQNQSNIGAINDASS